MPSPDAIRLQQMRDAVTAALGMASGRARADLSDNLMFAMALTRCLEILGEAASRVGAETRTQFPEIPWAQMVSMRNRLIHSYFDVDPDVVWTTVTDDLPGLLPVLETALAQIETR